MLAGGPCSSGSDGRHAVQRRRSSAASNLVEGPASDAALSRAASAADADAEEDPEGNWLMELRASTAGDPSSPGTPGAPDIAAAEAALFDPHDIRQTAARFRWPVQRQQWVVTDDGGTTRRHNSADAQKRGVPPYLLIMDLVFAAIFTATSQVMYLGHGGVALFFALFLPQMWLWMLTNYRYNGFDAEDISFELVNVLLMVGVMGLATNLKGCFCSLMTREDSWFLSYSNSSSTFAPVYSQMVDERCEGANEVEHVEGEVCALFFVTYAGVRLLLGALSLYVAYHVRRARALLWRELLVLIILVPLLFAIFVELGSDATSVTVVLWLAAMLIDVLLDVGCHVWLACTPASCEPVARALMLRVPMNIAYAEARYERMFVIAVGNVVANAIADSGHERFRTKWGAKTQLVIGVPWVALLLKLFYFDLSPHHGAGTGVHAMRSSVPRAVLWSLLHGPLLGCILWISTGLDVLIAGLDTDLAAAYDAASGDAATADDDPIQSAARWNFAAAMCCYLLCCTAQQVLHRGAGHGHRRLGRTKRMCVRGAFMFAFLLLPAVWQGAQCTGGLCNAGFFWALILGTTVCAVVELWGRGFSLPDDGQRTSVPVDSMAKAKAAAAGVGARAAPARASAGGRQGIELQTLPEAGPSPRASGVTGMLGRLKAESTKSEKRGRTPSFCASSQQLG